MKNIRIIPRLDIKGSNVVKPVHTEALRVVGNPKDLVRRYFEDGADEIIYMDIVASLYRRNLDFDLLRLVTDGIFIPVTVGGGIRSIHDVNNALRSGADKVAINTYAIHYPEFITEAAKEFGSQCVVLSVEAKQQSDRMWEAYTDGGREHSGKDVIEWIREGIQRGAGEIMITSIDQDGTLRGYDLELIKKITAFAEVPVIVYGGAGNKEDFKKAVAGGGADAIAAATIFHYQNLSISELKNYLRSENINVRIS